MNRCNGIEDLLDDYIDGRLPPDVLRTVDQHLEECSFCCETYQGFLVLRMRVAELPKAMQPDRDLWPAISERLASKRGVGHHLRFLLTWRAIAAAASILIAVGAVVMLQSFGRLDRASIELASERRQSVRGDIRSEVAQAEQVYIEAANGFLAELTSTDGILTPEAKRLLQGNLDITDRAISDIKAALENRPNDFALTRRLLAAHEQRVDMLQHVTRFSFANRKGG